MAKAFAKPFYNSIQWEVCRRSYISSVQGLCEHCRSKGIVKAGEEVHHIVELTEQNIHDTDITLGFDNLVLLCKECHNEEHNRFKKRERRYEIDENGAVIPLG